MEPPNLEEPGTQPSRHRGRLVKALGLTALAVAALVVALKVPRGPVPDDGRVLDESADRTSVQGGATDHGAGRRDGTGIIVPVDAASAPGGAVSEAASAQAGAEAGRLAKVSRAKPRSVLGGRALLVVETTPPGADVLLDGTLVGQTPLEA